MYNILFGRNPDGSVLLALIGLDEAAVGRFRDAWVTDDGEMAVYTRNGGGNRECWCKVEDYGTLEPAEDQIHLADCTWAANERMMRNPYYLRDEDDEFDNTYATFFFQIPPEVKARVDALKARQNEGYDETPSDRFLKVIQEIKGMTKEQLEKEFPELTSTLKKIADSMAK